MRAFAVRLPPGADIKQELVRITAEHQLEAGFVMTCVGSLRLAALRLADQPDTTFYEGKFEIVSLVGTLCPDGPHLHISISDGSGVTLGGHLQDGSQVYTTAEIVIGELEDSRFTRELDALSGYDELVVRAREG